MQESGFQVWTHDVTSSMPAPVYPDGCRDVVIIHRVGRPTVVTLSPFDMHPRLAALSVGSRLIGYRLRPGAQISANSLGAIASRPDKAADIIANDLTLSEDASAAIRALCITGAATAGVARDLGVSLRSLQRLFRGFALPPPDYWRLLARARQAVRKLDSPTPVAAIAADCGFSDQAHLTREMQRWFGKTPRQLQHDTETRTLLGQPALGNWTGEQISIR